MKNIFTSTLIPMLAALAFGCTSTTALQSSEADDLYYASTDNTVRPLASTASATSSQAGYASNPETSSYNSSSGTSNGGAADPEVTNPEYYAGSSGTAASGGVINNYNYYNSNPGFYSGSRVRVRSYNYYSYDPFYDPFYSPFGYSAAYCYGIYDPFWYPYCYPSSGVTISFNYGYGYGYPAYGYGGYYGYRPYNYYGGYGGYGNYYQGFYDGYYAGNGYGLGHRNRVYGKRNDRSNVPVNGVNPSGGRTAVPGRQGSNPRDPGRMGNADQPVIGTAPSQNIRPVRGGSQPENNPNQVTGRTQPEPARPVRSNVAGEVRPGNYQFQEQPVQESRPVIENARPVRSRDVEMPASRPTQQQEVAPAKPVQRDRGLFQERSQPEQQVQPERPVQRERIIQQQQPVQQARPVQPERPSRQEYSQPQRNSDFNGGRQGSSPTSTPSGNYGRPRR